MSINIVYEDDWLLVVNKPSGLLVIPTPKIELRTLTSILNDEIKKKDLSYRLHPCHRLDRETSGLIIYAKGKSTQKKMMDLFKNQKIDKSYIGFVQGHLPNKEGKISYPIEGMSAITRYEVMETRGNFDIVKIRPLTGRTNQIRIHFRRINHPLVGETKFAFRKDYALRAKRVSLHAQALKFIHPVTGKSINLTCSLAWDLEKFLKLHPN